MFSGVCPIVFIVEDQKEGTGFFSHIRRSRLVAFSCFLDGVDGSAGLRHDYQTSAILDPPSWISPKLQ